MSNRMTKWQKASALVPLALLSGAWTASLAVSSATAEEATIKAITTAIDEAAGLRRPSVSDVLTSFCNSALEGCCSKSCQRKRPARLGCKAGTGPSSQSDSSRSGLASSKLRNCWRNNAAC